MRIIIDLTLDEANITLQALERRFRRAGRVVDRAWAKDLSDATKERRESQARAAEGALEAFRRALQSK